MTSNLPEPNFIERNPEIITKEWILLHYKYFRLFPFRLTNYTNHNFTKIVMQWILNSVKFSQKLHHLLTLLLSENNQTIRKLST